MPRSYQIEWVNNQRPDIVFPAFYKQQSELLMGRIMQLAETYATLIESWMKANANWQDQSGDARRELWAEARRFSEEKIIITFGHGPSIYYGWYLENHFAGKYQIIAPALNIFSAMIEDDLRRIAG